jgi:hypothetical protein
MDFTGTVKAGSASPTYMSLLGDISYCGVRGIDDGWTRVAWEMLASACFIFLSY